MTPELKRTPAALETLADEHRYMSLLLDTLDKQLREINPKTPSDYFLAQDIIRYMHEYPDIAHHPTEDLMFKSLVERDPDAQSDVDRLLNDHIRLATITGDIVRLLEHASKQQTTAALHKARSAVDSYVDRLRGHMRYEETVMFPHAANCLTDEDWAHIESSLAAMDDPLFGHSVDSNYRVLYEYFSNRARSVSRQITNRGYSQLDNMILSADALEAGLGEYVDLVHQLVANISRESRKTFDDTFTDFSPKRAVRAQLRFALFLGKEAGRAGGSAANLYVKTLVRMATPFVARK